MHINSANFSPPTHASSLLVAAVLEFVQGGHVPRLVDGTIVVHAAVMAEELEHPAGGLTKIFRMVKMDVVGYPMNPCAHAA